jgi:hypothetical protein
MVNRLYLQYNNDSSNLSFSKFNLFFVLFLSPSLFATLLVDTLVAKEEAKE